MHWFNTYMLFSGRLIEFIHVFDPISKNLMKMVHNIVCPF